MARPPAPRLRRASAVGRAVRTALAGALAAGLSIATPGASASGDAGVRGRVSLPVAGAALRDLGPIVVYLAPVDDAARTPAPAEAPVIRQKNARFSPAFQVVSVGQSVEMANDDFIFHNVFSYSRPNHFDLGVYPAGESRFVTFRSPGVVKTYCSIHESMNATLFVAPSPYHTLVDGRGDFEIRGVPPGRYRLETWCEKLPGASREIDLQAGRTLRVDLDLGAPTR